jgi:tRNA(fMet)-specific endonuclease VapC
MIYLLDTNIVSYLIRARLPQPEVLRDEMRRRTVAISIITKAEMIFGIENNPGATTLHKRVRDFLATTNSLPWEDADAEHYGSIAAYLGRNGERIGRFDEMIAAQARARQLIVITNNIKHFARVPGLAITNWPLQAKGPIL